MGLPNSFRMEHCPCLTRDPCPDRSPTCRTGCDAWTKWKEIEAEELHRYKMSMIADRYGAAVASNTINRGTQYKARKHFYGQGRKQKFKGG